MSERQAVADAVEKRLDGLDEFFISAVAAFEQGAREKGDVELAGVRPLGRSAASSAHDEQLTACRYCCSTFHPLRPEACHAPRSIMCMHAERLGAIQQEVLEQVAARLPAELRLLDTLQRLPTRSALLNLARRCSGRQRRLVLTHQQTHACSIERVEAIREACASGSASVSALAAVANQVIDDMEDKAAVVDTRLLARLCLAREEILIAAASLPAEQQAEVAKQRSAYQRLLPQGTAAFIKELLAVTSTEKR